MANHDENVIDILESHHREVDALFVELEKAETGKKDIVTTLAQKLLAHMLVEQTIVYPAFATAIKGAVYEGYEEHEVARFALSRVLTTRSNDATFDAKIKALREIIEHHVKEEETRVFPAARAYFDEATLKELGANVSEAYEAMATGRPATLLRRAERVAVLKKAS